MKTLYLPFVLEKDLRKGYRAIVDEEEAWGFTLLYLYRSIRRGGFKLGKYERIIELYGLNYPVLMKCYSDKCYFFDIEKKVLIRDHGIIGSLALLSTHSSLSPYFVDSIDLNYSYSNDLKVDEDYSVPLLKSGEGIYRLTYVFVKLRDKNDRLLIQPPIYYIPPSALYSTLVMNEFVEFRRLLSDPLSISGIQSLTSSDRGELCRGILVKAKAGLEKLVDKKLIDAKDVLRIMYLID